MQLNRTKLLPSGLILLSESLTINKTLTSLHLGSNPINMSGASALAAALPQAPALTELILTNCSISSEVIKALAPGIGHPSTRLKSLNLENNNIGDSGCQALGPALGSNHHWLTLRLTRNPFGPPGCEELAKGLAQTPAGLERSIHLQHLVNVSPFDVPALFAVAENHGTLNLHTDRGIVLPGGGVGTCCTVA